MTCIIGFKAEDGIIIAGDRTAVSGLDKTLREDKKIFEKDGIVFGFTSSYRMGQLIKYHTEFSIPNDEELDVWLHTIFIEEIRKVLFEGGYTTKDSNKETAGFFLFGLKGKIYGVDSDLQIVEPTLPYYSVGCGEKYALASLWTNIVRLTSSDSFYPKRYLNIIKTALECAETFSNGVQRPFDYIIQYTDGMLVKGVFK